MYTLHIIKWDEAHIAKKRIRKEYRISPDRRHPYRTIDTYFAGRVILETLITFLLLETLHNIEDITWRALALEEIIRLEFVGTFFFEVAFLYTLTIVIEPTTFRNEAFGTGCRSAIDAIKVSQIWERRWPLFEQLSHSGRNLVDFKVRVLKTHFPLWQMSVLHSQNVGIIATFTLRSTRWYRCGNKGQKD